VLAPGIYHLEAPLLLNKPNQVLLGLGLATLIPTNGDAAVKVGNVDGVRVAGILLEAGPNSKSLLTWGQAGEKFQGNPLNPGFMHDVFFRVGGLQGVGVSVDQMLVINSGHVHGDDLWLWRADHVEGGGPCQKGGCLNKNGLVVNGDDVTFTGLAVEHALEDLVQWNGERGSTYFFQAEYPYGVNQSYGDKFVAYRVAPTVQAHQAYGVAVYHFFRDFPVVIKTGIVCPPALESSFKSPLGVFLNGKGTMTHIINDKGPTTQRDAAHGDSAFVAYYCANGVGSNQTEFVEFV